MAASSAVGSVFLTSTTLSSSNSLSSTSLKIAPSPASAGVPRVVAVRAAHQPEKEQQQKTVTRRDVVANLLGAGAAMGVVGQALAANPGTLPRSLNRKKEEKPEGKKE